MNKTSTQKRQLLLAISLICALASYFLLKKPSFQDPMETSGFFTEEKYFVPLKINSFSRANDPQLEVKIENETVLTKVDLGFSGGIRLPKDFIQSL